MSAPLMIAWDGYTPFDAGVRGPLRDASRADAEAHFARLMAARPTRRDALAALAARHVVALEPEALGAWLAAALPGEDAAIVSGLCVDLALWLGDRIVDAAGGAVQWALFVAHKKATGYQRPVLVGFAKVDAPHYYVDVAFLIASWADLAARGRAARGDFLATIERVTLADAA